MLDIAQKKIQIQLSLVFIMLDITKICFYILECRWQQGVEAEAEAMARVLMPQFL